MQSFKHLRKFRSNFQTFHTFLINQLRELAEVISTQINKYYTNAENSTKKFKLINLMQALWPHNRLEVKKLGHQMF